MNKLSQSKKFFSIILATGGVLMVNSLDVHAVWQRQQSEPVQRGLAAQNPSLQNRVITEEQIATMSKRELKQFISGEIAVLSKDAEKARSAVAKENLLKKADVADRHVKMLEARTDLNDMDKGILADLKSSMVLIREMIYSN